MDLKGKVAIVTGGTGGLGRRICYAFARAGANVALVYRQSHDEAKAWADELSAEFGVRVVPFAADVTKTDEINALPARVAAEFGRIDVLVNDAAYNKWVAFNDLDGLTEEFFEYMLRYNVTSPLLMSKAVAPYMKKQRAGRIINIASIAGLTPSGSSIAYATSKAALIHLTRCLAVGLAPETTVNCVAPGLMEGTRMTANLDPSYAQRSRDTVALKRAADKDDVANQVVTFAQSETITGQTLVIDAGRVYH